MNDERAQQINLLIGTNEGVYRSPLNAIAAGGRLYAAAARSSPPW
jgi:hypothetical protein